MGALHRFLENIKVCHTLRCLNSLVKNYILSPLIIKTKIEKIAI